MVVGLLAAAASGVLYLLSLGFTEIPQISVAIILLGRGLLGGAESFIITTAVSWGLALADSRSTGEVIAWVGSAMFAAFAIGAPAGAALYASHGFVAIGVATAAAPLLTLLIVAPLRTVAPVVQFVMLAAVTAIIAAPTSAVAGCYRLGETGYHWYRSCWGPRWIYPHQRVCRHGHCWYR